MATSAVAERLTSFASRGPLQARPGDAAGPPESAPSADLTGMLENGHGEAARLPLDPGST